MNGGIGENGEIGED